MGRGAELPGTGALLELPYTYATRIRCTRRPGSRVRLRLLLPACRTPAILNIFVSELSVLIVAASSEDSESLVNELRRAGYDPVSARVDTRDSMERALYSKNWDVVLSEFATPAFGALAALALLKERHVDIPFIVVSDVTDEAVIPLVMRAGAHDFIDKKGIGRLAPSVEREMSEVRVRRGYFLGQKALRESEGRLRATLLESALRFRVIAEISNDLIYEWEIASGAVGWFADIDRELGYQPDEFPRTREAWKNVIHPDDRDRVVAAVARHQETGERFSEEYRVVRKDGAVLVWSDLGKVIRDVRGNAIKWVGVVTDVSERRWTEAALREREERLRTLLKNAPGVLFEIDRDGLVTRFEGKALEALGLFPAGSSGQSVWELYRDFPDILEHLRRALRGDAHTSTVPVGELVFEAQYVPYRAPNGEVLGVIALASDVTKQRTAEGALLDSEARYRTLFERSLAGVYLMTLDGRILDCNDSFARILGYASREELLERPVWDFHPTIGDFNGFVARVRERRTLTNYEDCLRRKDGSTVWVLENITLFERPADKASLLLGTAIDITESKQVKEQVKYMAVHDSVTGLPNRILFNDRLTIALSHAQRNRWKLATFFLNLDRFKAINESLGRPIGDQLLQRVAERVRATIRAGDTVARFGANEFAVFVQRISSEEDAAKVAQKVLEAVRLPFSIDQKEVFITTSIGVSLYPMDGTDVETLARNAEMAVYRAKEQGRDNYQLYSPDMNARAVERLSLENQLHKALQREELTLYFQPVIDLRSGQIRGAEALLRWRHPTLGLLAPARFISLAEVSGLILPIGQWVLQAACEQVREWQAMGFPDLRMAVNVSQRQFQHPDFVLQVTQAIEETRVSPRSLDLEITESSAMLNPEVSISKLLSLRRAGVLISVDDFGTGYSSLNHLKLLPIDRVKLDQSFVQGLTSSPEDAAIARAVITLAHTLKLPVVAEGVETEEQLAFLRRRRCDEVQGHLFSPAIPAQAFQELLKNRASAS
jgi:diguanylate cyclase (GGDEF)-like protein/PAS domain S-box-containing protein